MKPRPMRILMLVCAMACHVGLLLDSGRTCIRRDPENNLLRAFTNSPNPKHIAQNLLESNSFTELETKSTLTYFGDGHPRFFSKERTGKRLALHLNKPGRAKLCFLTPWVVKFGHETGGTRKTTLSLNDVFSMIRTGFTKWRGQTLGVSYE